MAVKLHHHAQDRLKERGASEEEIVLTVEQGETFTAKYGRTGFRRNFQYNKEWRGRNFATKQVEAYAVEESGEWLVITVITRYF